MAGCLPASAPVGRQSVFEQYSHSLMSAQHTRSDPVALHYHILSGYPQAALSSPRISRARQSIAITSEAAVMTKPSFLGTPFTSAQSALNFSERSVVKVNTPLPFYSVKV